ncbi:RluA family pseudouridine synthase [Desulfomarina sp.]
MEDKNLSRFSDDSFLFKISNRETGLRLDQFLSSQLQTVSRTRISTSIRSGLITVDNRAQKASYRLKAGETVAGTFIKPPALEVLPEKIDFTVLFEDSSLIILSKPPGIVVHPGSGNYTGTLVNGLVHYCRSITAVGDSLRPGIVHRLDKDTSGIMVAAKTEPVQMMLMDTFKNRKVKKSYLALLHGLMRDRKGRISAPIGRHPVNRKKMTVLPGRGRHAASSWEVIAESDNRFSLVKIVIETGRTHQIRVHMAHLGHPVVGDCVYGSNRKNSCFPRQLLHAHRLVLQHPVKKTMLDMTAPLWPDFVQVLKELGMDESLKQ